MASPVRAAPLALLTLLALTALPAAAEPAGHIKRMEGDVRIVRNKQTLTATPGSEVLAGDRLVTGANGSVGLTTSDNTLLALGPNSHLVMDNYAYNQATQQGNIAVRFLKGSFAVITGLIGKIAPQNVKVTTPTATIGIRGTEFVVKVDLPAELEAEVLNMEEPR
jgi:hypothetical protein